MCGDDSYAWQAFMRCSGTKHTIKAPHVSCKVPMLRDSRQNCVPSPMPKSRGVGEELSDIWRGPIDTSLHLWQSPDRVSWWMSLCSPRLHALIQTFPPVCAMTQSMASPVSNPACTIRISGHNEQRWNDHHSGHWCLRIAKLFASRKQCPEFAFPSMSPV
jgi:hypothetical protein